MSDRMAKPGQRHPPEDIAQPPSKYSASAALKSTKIVIPCSLAAAVQRLMASSSTTFAIIDLPEINPRWSLEVQGPQNLAK